MENDSSKSPEDQVEDPIESWAAGRSVEWVGSALERKEAT